MSHTPAHWMIAMDQFGRVQGIININQPYTRPCNIKLVEIDTQSGSFEWLMSLPVLND